MNYNILLLYYIIEIYNTINIKSKLFFFYRLPENAHIIKLIKIKLILVVVLYSVVGNVANN